MRVMIAGGGTGGHIYPGIAVAEEVRRLDPKTQFLFVGSDRGLESKVVPSAGFDLATLPARGVMRTRWWRFPMTLWANISAVFKAYSLMKKFRPDVILGTGGYVALPVGVAALLLRQPLIIQEQNSIPGLANRVMSRWALEIHLAFTEARRYLWQKERLKLSGNPVRRVILSGNRRSALARFGLKENVPTAFIFGGSRGARRITNAALDAMRRLKGSIKAQYILQTGKEDFARAKEETEKLGVGAVVVPYVTRIHEAYAAADVVVCRAGAMTLAEIAACGVPSILVPYPHAAYDHQVKNAQSLTERGAATMILDHDLTGERLAQELLALMRDRETLVRYSAHARTFARPDAAERIARSLLSYRPRNSQGAQPVSRAMEA